MDTIADFWGHPAPWGRLGTAVHMNEFCHLKIPTFLASTINYGPEGYLCTQAPSIEKQWLRHCMHKALATVLAVISLMPPWCSVCCMRGCCMFMLIFMSVLCPRHSISLWAGQGQVDMDLWLSRKFPESIEKRDSPSLSAGGGCPWHHSHTRCLCDPVVGCSLPVTPHSTLPVCVCIFKSVVL